MFKNFMIKVRGEHRSQSLHKMRAFRKDSCSYGEGQVKKHNISPVGDVCIGSSKGEVSEPSKRQLAVSSWEDSSGLLPGLGFKLKGAHQYRQKHSIPKTDRSLYL